MCVNPFDTHTQHTCTHTQERRHTQAHADAHSLLGDSTGTEGVSHYCLDARSFNTFTASTYTTLWRTPP